MWSSKAVNARKGNQSAARSWPEAAHRSAAPKELPVTALIRNSHGVAEWNYS